MNAKHLWQAGKWIKNKMTEQYESKWRQEKYNREQNDYKERKTEWQKRTQ